MSHAPAAEFHSGIEPVDSMYRFRRLPHLLAVITAALLLPLVFVGAGVTSKDAGMAYPDWPTSDGKLVNPPRWWSNEHTRWEHGHRLIGWTVGFSALLLAGASFRAASGQKWAALATLPAIGLQGILGGLRVTQDSTPLAMLHGIWGQVCFCLACGTALVTSRAWLSGPRAVPIRSGLFLRRLCLATAISVFLQLVFGAALRHFTSGVGLVVHVLWAIVVVSLAQWTSMWVIGLGPSFRPAVHFAKWVGALTVIQLFLGGFAWLVSLAAKSWPTWMVWLVPTFHVLVGALLLVSTVLLTACAYRSIDANPANRPSCGPSSAS